MKYKIIIGGLLALSILPLTGCVKLANPVFVEGMDGYVRHANAAGCIDPIVQDQAIQAINKEKARLGIDVVEGGE